MNKTVLGGIGISLALVLSLIGVFKHSTVVQPVTQQFGGTSPDFASPYISIGGISEWYSRSSTLVSSTTPCAIQSPIATSTLQQGSFDFSSSTATGGPNTTTRVTIAKSATAFATTTTLAQISMSSPVMNFPLIASTTPPAGSANTLVFQPNTWLVVSVEGATGYSFTGTCTAQFTQIDY